MKGPVLFQNQPAFEIQDDLNRITIVPDHGARVLHWVHQEHEVITWPESADWNQILKVRGGDPVLFPFVARHFVDGVVDQWKDGEGVIRPMPIHGFARDARFTVIDDPTENTLRMRLKDSTETRHLYPYAFQFDVVVTLHPRSCLEIRFETTNCGDEAMPYYAGHHFYFPMPHAERSQWKLHLPCASWARQTPTGAIVHQEATAETLPLDDPALIDRFQVKPLDSKIILAHIDGKRRLVFELNSVGSIPWYAVTTWTQTPTSDFYCIEPWLGLPNAIHHREGLRWLEPGQTEMATCILDANDWI